MADIQEDKDIKKENPIELCPNCGCDTWIDENSYMECSECEYQLKL